MTPEEELCNGDCESCYECDDPRAIDEIADDFLWTIQQIVDKEKSHK